MHNILSNEHFFPCLEINGTRREKILKMDVFIITSNKLVKKTSHTIQFIMLLHEVIRKSTIDFRLAQVPGLITSIMQ